MIMEPADPSDARAGDEIVVESHRVRGAQRSGVICEVLGTAERPYYRVRWQDGRETLFHPGSDARILPKDGRRTTPAKRKVARKPAAKPAPPARTSRVPRQMGLRASAGDRLVIRGHEVGAPSRDAEILEVLGADGSPPFRVRWSETGREALIFPGSDAVVEHYRHTGGRTQAHGRTPHEKRSAA
jgi:hypothetical protein